MRRNVDLNEISDGKLYTSNDMVKADCYECQGCSACCRGMGKSIILDPIDLFHLKQATGKDFAGLLNQTATVYTSFSLKYFSSVTAIKLATREDIGRTIDFAAGRNRYIGYLISLPTRSFKNIRVGLDCSNGSSSAIAKSVFDALGAKTYVINNEPDGTNINMNCGSTHIEILQKFVKEQGLDVGFAYDGDADRCIAVDENGEVVDGDRILYVCGKYMMEQGALKDNTIVTTVMSNLGLYKACDQVGLRYEKTAVGDKYVYENMSQNGYQLGGEQSGHIIFSKHATTGDGILTSLKIMEVMLEKKASLGTLAGEVKIYPQLLQNLRVQDMDATLNHPDVQKAIKEVEDRLGTEGRVLVRKSGTEPLLRVMVEALSDELCEESVLHIINAMKSV